MISKKKLKEQFGLISDVCKGCQFLDCGFAGFTCRKSCDCFEKGKAVCGEHDQKKG